MRAGTIEAAICRAPEFYGPGKTQSLSNSAVFNRIKEGKRPTIPVSAHTKRTLIWTPDASRAMGLIGNTPDAYGQTWHLPIDPDRLTYAQMIEIASEVTGRTIRSITIPERGFRIVGRFNPAVKEASELLPRYRGDNFRLHQVRHPIPRLPDHHLPRGHHRTPRKLTPTPNVLTDKDDDDLT